MQRVDLILVVSSSLEVYPTNTLPDTAIHHGVMLTINPFSKTSMDLYADVLLSIDVTELIPGIFRIIIS